MKTKFFMMLFAFLVLFSGHIQAAGDVHVTDAGNSWFLVKFYTPQNSNGILHYGENFYDLNKNIQFSYGIEHTINVTGLSPNTLYYFDIEDNSGRDSNNGRHYRFVTNIGSGKTYFLSNNGSDSDDGSYDHPWKTIAHAKSELKPGDTLLIMDGIYKGPGENAGIVFFQHDSPDGRYNVSGEPGNPITYRAYNKGYGVHPVFDAEFSEDACSDYHCFVFKTVYAHDLVFDSLWVKNVANHLGESGGFILRYSDRIDIIDCYASNIIGGDRGELSGAFLFCGTHNSTVKGTKAWNLHGSSIQNKGAVNLFYGAGSNRYSINVNTTMSEFWDADAGVQVKSWGQKNAVFTNNFFHDVSRGIHDIGANTLIKGNIIFNASIAHSSLNDYYHDPGPRPVIEHNTFVDFDKGTDFADWHYPLVNVSAFKNNILFSKRQGDIIVHDTYYPGCQQSDRSPCPAPYNDIGSQAIFQDSDYNLFYSTSNSDIFEYMGERMDLQQYRQDSGYEQHSLQEDPLLIDADNRDFRLSESSVARHMSSSGGYIGAIDPSQEIGRIEIWPTKIDIEPGEQYLFVAKLFDKNGNEIPPGHFPVKWSCINGRIDENGLYNRTTSLPDTITAEVSGFTDAVTIGSQNTPVCEATTGNCYYADNHTNGDCSFQNPCNISTALSKMSAGDYLYLLGGVYSDFYSHYSTEAIINLDKYFSFNDPKPTKDNPVVIKSYPEQKAIIKGDYSKPCIWVDGNSNIIFEGLDIQQCWEAGIRLQEDVDVSNIIIRNCTFHEIVCNDNMGGVYVGGADNVVIDHNEFYDCYYQGTRDLLDTPQCRGSAMHFFRATNITISNNNIHHTCSGMYYKHGEPVLGSGGYTRIINNTWHDLYGWCIGINQNRAELRNNLVIGCGINLYQEDGTVGPFLNGVAVENNTIINGFVTLNRNSDTGPTYLGAVNITIKNNILYNSSYNIWVYGSDEQYYKGINLTSDNNCFYKPSGEFLVNYFGNNNPAYGGENTGGYYPLDNWKNLGFDLHSIEADPMFVDFSSGNFHLKNKSPCKGMGAYASGTFISSHCASQADTNSDSVISMQELITYINQWLSNSITINQLVEAIKEWKGGCGG